VWLVVAAGLAAGDSRSGAQDSDENRDPAPGLNAGVVAPLQFRNLGPALMSGRIGDIVVDPTDRSTWYVAAASGGVWKTENSGVTWEPIFDRYGSYSIGCLALDPQDRFTLWVGTGENNSQRSVGYGDGLYKSMDGGRSFTKVGLEDSQHIGKIVVHPEDSQTVWVAAQGPLWNEGGQRGLYKTVDGGQTWSQVLDLGPHTGVNEVHVDPTNPQILYASAYQRRRHTWVLINGGPESTLYKSTDGGETWRKINRGLPSGDLGRIGLAVSPINSELVYAIVEATAGQSGFFRSQDRGESWQRMSDYVSDSPQYYQEIVACPHQLDRIYSLDTYLMVSEDGGRNFNRLGEADKHVDNHALIIDPQDPAHLLVGCDGGVYETWDRGKTYDFKANLPLTQFYKIAVSNERPFYFVYGGTQDNATQGGPSQTTNLHGIRNSDWFITVFGDGFGPAVDPNDPDTIYSQWQYGGLVRYDRKSGEAVDIKPQESAEGPPLRWNWDSPLLISPHNSQRIYYGSQILFRSDDRGDHWTAISGDLTRQIDRNQLKVMGKVWGVDAIAKNASTSLYGNLVAMAESPLQPDLLFTGSDDGLVQISADGGGTWRSVDRFGGLDVPEFGYINDIEPDRFDAHTVYVAVNNHKRGDFRPYLVRSNDLGETWTDISGDLPARGSVYTIRQDHVKPELLFCGTEFGCYFTIDGGQKWIQLKSGVPTIAIRDIKLQREQDDVVLGSFGRGIMILDDYSPLRELSEALLATDHVFPIQTGLMYRQVAPLALGGKAFQGANFFTAPNPPYGVTFTFHFRAAMETAKQKRQQQDQQRHAAGQDVPYPAWEALKAEDREANPQRWLTIRDAQGAVVRRQPVSTGKGLVRTQWDFCYAGFSGGRRGGSGPMAAPGQYTVEVQQMSEGKIENLIPPTEFQIEPITFVDLGPDDRQQIVDFCQQAARLSNAVQAANQSIATAREQLSELEQLTLVAPEVEPELWNDVRALQLQLQDLAEQLTGDPTRPRRNEAEMPGLLGRLQTAQFGALGSTAGPTGTHRAQYEIAAQQFAQVEGKLRPLLEKQLPKLMRQFDDRGAPWTSGRRLPKQP
jgi:photosystem II stability/assembly factor-like uncharacterized protein